MQGAGARRLCSPSPSPPTQGPINFDEDKFINGNEVLEALLNSEILSNLAEVRDETSSGFVAAQFSDL